MRARIGDYEVDGFGAEGVVRYAATHVVLPRRAVIELSDPTVPRARAVQMMRRACVLEALHHPGVPRVYECGMLDGRPWVAFEQIEGVSLEVDLRTRRLSADEVLDMLEHVTAILVDAHARGVLHRDITPAVILRCQNRGYPYVLDGWSSACTLDTELANPLKGNQRYRAPELVNDRPADGRADVFALGASAREAFTGSLREAPLALAHLLEAMTTYDDLLRPTAVEVRRAIRDIRDEPPLVAPPVRNKPRWTPPLGFENDGAVAPCVVEILPRGRPDTRR